MGRLWLACMLGLVVVPSLAIGLTGHISFIGAAIGGPMGVLIGTAVRTSEAQRRQVLGLRAKAQHEPADHD